MMKIFVSGILFVLSVAGLHPVLRASTAVLKTIEIQKGSIVGKVVDAETGEELGWTTMLVEDIDRSVSAHEDGSFHLFDIPAGKYTLKTFRIGYIDAGFPVEVFPGDTTRLTIRLRNNPLSTESVVVEGNKYAVRSELMQPDVEVSGRKLRQSLGMTIAETIETEPGIAQRTMGPAPARPVLRGLSGDRLLLLEDGERTGDLSATSSDHAVVIEPVASDRIEVIRGPAALIYGSNTLGGVINVERGYVPSTLPHRVTGSVSAQGESVNSGYVFGTGMTVPAGAFAARIDGSIRRADDIESPEGTLVNTDIRTDNASGGLTYFPAWGHLGVSGSWYDSEYGIPPDPNGGHPDGVDIELNRRHTEFRSEIYPGYSWLYLIDGTYSYKRYEHTEIESNEQVGVRFGVITHNLSLLTHFNEKGSLTHGEIGLWGEYRDYASAGLNFTPPSRELSYALFAYGEHNLGQFAFSASLRYDHKTVRPDEEKFVERADFNLYIRERKFDDLSAALKIRGRMGTGFFAGVTVMRTFRGPGIEELFSEGPHLAAYSYEVGNSELGNENGFGLELFLDYETDAGNIHLALFRNDIRGYIFPKNTGRRSLRRGDLFLYQYVGEHTLMVGAETGIEWRLTDIFDVSGNLSYVYGELVDLNEPIPRIPPLEGRAALRYGRSNFSLESAVRFAADQTRAGEFETPTPGFAVFDMSAQYYMSGWGVLHTFTLSVENLTDAVYRQHLNRVKDIMPEPGRNFRLLYKIFF